MFGHFKAIFLILIVLVQESSSWVCQPASAYVTEAWGRLGVSHSGQGARAIRLAPGVSSIECSQQIGLQRQRGSFLKESPDSLQVPYANEETAMQRPKIMKKAVHHFQGSIGVVIDSCNQKTTMDRSSAIRFLMGGAISLASVQECRAAEGKYGSGNYEWLVTRATGPANADIYRNPVSMSAMREKRKHMKV
jgi:hypothetical protein